MTTLTIKDLMGGMTDDVAREHLDRIRQADLIALDTETTGLAVRDGRNYCMGISIAYRHSLGLLSVYFPIRHNVGSNISVDVRNDLLDIIHSKRIIFHNSKFDIHSLQTLGLDLTGCQFYCTQEMAHMVNEEWPSKKLDYLSMIILHDRKDKSQLDLFLKAVKNDWSQIPVSLMSPYACHDAELTYRLFEYLKQELERQELHVLWPTQRKFIHLLRKVERRGIILDQPKCENLKQHGIARMGAIVDEIGFEPSRPTHLARVLFDELKYPVLYRTPEGKPSFAKKAMEEYDILLERDGSDLAKRVFEYRGWQKSVGAFYDGWLQRVSPDGRLRPNFKTHGTVTGRLSCEDPNLQQIPRESPKAWNGPAKKCFLAESGFSLYEFDYSQLEFRLAAAYGNEQGLIQEFIAGIDPFERGATEVFGEFTPENRQKMKTLTYSILFGAGVNRIKNALGLDDVMATAIRDKFYTLYPGIYRAFKRATRITEQRGYVKYWTGRRRHIADANFAYKAFNSVIQGGAAEMVKRTMLRLEEVVDSETECRMVLQVHDSVWFEIRNDVADSIVPVIEKLMADWPEFGVPLPVEGKLLHAN